MEVVGEYFSVVAISSIIAVLIHFGFAQAVPLMDEKEVRVGITILTGMTLFLIAIGFVAAVFSGYLFFVFLVSGIISFITLIDAILIREGRVKPIAVLRICSPFLGFSSAIFSGYFLGDELDVLIGSYFFGMFVVILALFRYAIWSKLVRVHKDQFRKLIFSYSRFPRFIGPGLIFHTAAYNLPSIIGLHYFGGGVVAAYNLAYKIVLAPMTILGQAIGQAYISKLSHAYRNSNSLKAGIRLDAVLFTIAFTVSVFVYVAFPWIAMIIFPEHYTEISAYAIALIPLVFSMIAIAPLANLLQFTGNQKKIFYMHTLSFMGSVTAFSIAIYLEDFLLGVVSFSWFMMARYAWLYFEILMVRKHQC